MRHEIDRRRFLQATGLGLGALLAGCARSSASSEAAGQMADTMRAGASGGAGTAAAGARTSHIGVQLYSVRASMEKDMAATLKSVADIGYPEVEFAGYYKHDPKDVRAMLDRVGLRAPSSHVPLEALRASVPNQIAAAQAVGHELVICPWAKLATLDEWKRLADDFNKYGAAFNERGIRFGYHNHDHEFAAIDGQMPFDVLLANTDPKLVAFEMDLFWVTKAGQDPVAYFDKHPGRFPAVHVKDMRGLKSAQEMTAVGDGEIDFARIFAKANTAGIQHYIVEHDNPADPIASIRTSYGNVRKLLA